MMRRRHFISLVIGLLLCQPSYSEVGHTYLAETVEARNRSPIMQLYELASPTYTRFGESGSVNLGMQLEAANYLSLSGRQNGEELFVDGETWLTTLSASYQINRAWQTKVSASLRGHGRGVFDRFIYHFHDVLQLPQNGRTDNFHDRLLWRLNNAQGTILELDSATGDIGDVLLELAWQPHPAQQVQFHLGVPLGDIDTQTGNEGVDIGVAWLGQNPEWLQNRGWLTSASLALWYGAGITWVDHPQELAALDERPWSFSLRGGIGWRAMDAWQLKVQFDSHRALFDTEIRELGWMPVQITLASKHNVAKYTVLEVSLVEDLRPRVTPDVVFSLALNTRL